MKQEELNQILENHRHWINRDCDGWKNMRADLRGANISGAIMSGAILIGADMRGADMCGTVLIKAKLHEAEMCGAIMREADMSGANMYGANLRGADMRGANLRGADMRGTIIQGADLRGAKSVPHIPLSCPSDGAFVGWKKAKCKRGDIIVKLEIPEDAKRSSATGTKCRCDKAKVLGFYDMDRKAVSSDMDVRSKYDKEFKYRIGEIVSVINFDDDRYNECAPGIHFFIDREEAIKYMG